MEATMIAYVICCDDRIEGVVLNSEKNALIKLEELKKFQWSNLNHGYNTKEEYDYNLYWHLIECEVYE